MAIPFVRSLRGLEDESSRPSVTALVLAGALLAAWVGWLLFASIPLHEASQDWTLERDGTLTVRFPAASMARLRAGQRGALSIPGEPGEAPQQMEAAVVATPSRSQPRLGPLAVKVRLLSGERAPKEGGGTVTIEVGTISPLQAIERAGARLGSDLGHLSDSAGGADQGRR